MDKKRLVIMNRHCITQVIDENGKWRDAKIEKALERPPGIFNLHAALSADPAQVHGGVILYVDQEHVYQEVGKSIVVHKLASFDRVPSLGVVSLLRYLGDRVDVSPSKADERKRTRS
ncbi:MAG: conjugal transfer protein TraO [Proteobacteria bacterium]|nr:MAG: conjugal transfer protein TraO [Pseudomonadota bacterium]